MKKVTLKKRICDFIESEKTGEGRALSEAFVDALVDCVHDDIFAEVKRSMDRVKIEGKIPEAAASAIKGFKHDLGKNVYYILFKQVRRQSDHSLQIKLGWQYDVLTGRTEEIQVRSDYGILYRVGGNWVLQDHIFDTRDEAVVKCNLLNEGTAAFALK